MKKSKHASMNLMKIRLKHVFKAMHQNDVVNTCPTENTLACYLEDTIDECDKDQIEKHLVHCDRCRQTIATAKSVELFPDVPLPIYKHINIQDELCVRSIDRSIPTKLESKAMSTLKR